MNRKYRKTVIAGNWKMNQLCSGVKPFIEQLREAMPRTKTCEVVLCTPALMIPAMVRAGKDARVAAGGQDVSKYEKGAYTGEISADMLLDAGAKYCIVGHSERREYHHESDSLINEKAKALLAKGITPIICVGESLEQREKDLTMEYIAYQVCAALSGIDVVKIAQFLEHIVDLGQIVVDGIDAFHSFGIVFGNIDHSDRKANAGKRRAQLV